MYYGLNASLYNRHAAVKMIIDIIPHFLQQTAPAMEMGSCQYRTSDGNKCFIGALIPDWKYTEEMEDTDALNRLVFKTISKLGYNDPYFAVLLQNIHDDFDDCDSDYSEIHEKRIAEWKVRVAYHLYTLLGELSDPKEFQEHSGKLKEIFEGKIDDAEEQVKADQYKLYAYSRVARELGKLMHQHDAVSNNTQQGD